MADTGAPHSLPYPTAADAPNGPAQIQALAAQTATRLTAVAAAANAAAGGIYRTVSEAAFAFTSSNTAGTYFATLTGGVTQSGSTAGHIVLPLAAADYAVSGLSTKFRLESAIMTNTIAPAIDFTVSLAEVTTLTGTSGNLIVATGSAISSYGIAVPAASTAARAAGSDFTLSPTSGVFVLRVGLSNTPAANSITVLRVRLTVRNT